MLLHKVPGSELELLDVADDALRAANQFTLEAFKYVAGVKHESYNGTRRLAARGTCCTKATARRWKISPTTVVRSTY